MKTRFCFQLNKKLKLIKIQQILAIYSSNLFKNSENRGPNHVGSFSSYVNNRFVLFIISKNDDFSLFLLLLLLLQLPSLNLI